MKNLFFLVALTVLLVVPAFAQDAPKGELFGGYSYLRVNPGEGVSGINLNGWNASVAGNVNNWFGVAADFSGHYGTPTITIPGVGTAAVKTRGHMYTFGPRLSYRADERYTPFAHALFGGVNVKGSSGGVGTSSNGFAMLLGGGLDIKLNDSAAFRLLQGDYVLNRMEGDSTHNFRFSTGIVFRFGRR